MKITKEREEESGGEIDNLTVEDDVLDLIVEVDPKPKRKKKQVDVEGDEDDVDLFAPKVKNRKKQVDKEVQVIDTASTFFVLQCSEK